ncbi:MAG TPA: hypothetical protein DEH78_14345, partial [Solibacterales bacterium]|nr:hypothetical protein [Bryobacterales bacterium]
MGRDEEKETEMPETNATLTPAALGDVKFDRARGFGIEIECYAPIEATAVAEALTLAGVTCAFEGYHHTTRANW